MKKKKDNFNNQLDEKIKIALMWFNQLDYPSRELVLLEAFDSWHSPKVKKGCGMVEFARDNNHYMICGELGNLCSDCKKELKKKEKKK